MNPLREHASLLTRRHFFGRASTGLGVVALASLLNDRLLAATDKNGSPSMPHFNPRAKRVIYLFQSGAPSQMDLFDYKPELKNLRGKELPDSIRRGQRLTGMTATQTSFPVAPSKFRFARHGQSGAWVSELMPHTGEGRRRSLLRQVDVHRGHQPRSGHHVLPDRRQLAGRPSMGAWVSYGLGSENHDLPAFVALVSQGTRQSERSAALRSPVGQRLFADALPGRQVPLRRRAGAVSRPTRPAWTTPTRRRMLDDLAKLNQLQLAGARRSGDRHAHRPVRAGLSHADVRCRS